MTKPPEDFGVSYATQAAYIRQAIAMTKKLPFVGMFIWFVYQDNPGQDWDSGLYTRGGAAKGSSPNAFASEREAARRAERGLHLPRRDAYPERHPVHAALLRGRHDRRGRSA